MTAFFGTVIILSLLACIPLVFLFAGKDLVNPLGINEVLARNGNSMGAAGAGKSVPRADDDLLQVLWFIVRRRMRYQHARRCLHHDAHMRITPAANAANDGAVTSNAAAEHPIARLHIFRCSKQWW